LCCHFCHRCFSLQLRNTKNNPPHPLSTHSPSKRPKIPKKKCSLLEVIPESQICGFCGSNTVPPDYFCEFRS
jgi:hypothetical protein